MRRIGKEFAGLLAGFHARLADAEVHCLSRASVKAADGDLEDSIVDRSFSAGIRRARNLLEYFAANALGLEGNDREHVADSLSEAAAEALGQDLEVTMERVASG